MYSSPLNWFSILFCFICSFQMVYSLLFHCILFLMCDFLLDFILLILFFFHYFSNYFIFFSVCQYYAFFFFFFKCGLLFWHAFIVAFTFFFFSFIVLQMRRYAKSNPFSNFLWIKDELLWNQSRCSCQNELV